MARSHKGTSISRWLSNQTRQILLSSTSAQLPWTSVELKESVWWQKLNLQALHRADGRVPFSPLPLSAQLFNMPAAFFCLSLPLAS